MIVVDQICVHGAPKNDDCVGYDYGRDAAFQWFEKELFEALEVLRTEASVVCVCVCV